MPPWRAIIATGLPLLLLFALAAAADNDNVPRADVAAARAAWAGSGWAGAPRARETPNDADAQDGLQGVLELFDGALAAYLRHAYPKDNLKPLSCQGEDWQGGGMAVTLIDALDALLVLPGRAHLLPLAVEALRRREAGVAFHASEQQGSTAAGGAAGGEGRAATAAAAAAGARAAAPPSAAYYGRDAKVHIFETTIRALGGLLSAHVLLSRLAPDEPLLRAPPPLANGNSSSSSGPPPSSSSSAAEASRALLARAAAASSSSPSPSSSSSWRYDGLLLRLARDLADRMLPAFRTRSGIPLAWAHLRGSKHTAALPDNHATCTACAGTLLLEFGLLSRLTGDGRYRRAAERAAEALFARRSRLGLVGSELAVAMDLRRERGGKGQGGRQEDDEDDEDDDNKGPRPHPHHSNAAATSASAASSSPWTNAVSTIGPGSDSFYEYALKAFLATGERRRLDEFASLYAAVRALMAAPATHAAPSSSSPNPLPPASFVLDVRMDDGRLAKPWVSSLGAFWPGLQALVGQVDDAAALQANFSAAAAAGSGWLPESFAADLSGAVHPHDPGWRLRPELVESAFLLHAATGDARHRDALAKPVLRSLRALLRLPTTANTTTATNATTATPLPRCDGALAHVADVRTGALEDSSESYLLSETLKYLALLLLPSGGGGGGNGGGSLVEAFVLTTEGHVALVEPWQGFGGGGASEADHQEEEDAADAAELAALARDGLLPANSDDDRTHTPPTCRALCASVGPAAALDGSERRAAAAAVARLSSALPLVRATWREARRLRRRRCAACVAVARHLLAHPPEPAARRSCRLNFGGAPQRVAHAAAASPLPLLPRPKPLRVPLPAPGRDAPPAHPATHHRLLPTAPEPLAAAVCHLDVGRWALGRGRLPLSCGGAHALGPLDLSTGQLPANAVVLQLSRVVVVEEKEEEEKEEHEGAAAAAEGQGSGDDAVLPSLRYALVVGFDGGGNNSSSRQQKVFTFAAAPAHFGPRPPLVASAACAARVLEPGFAPRSPSPCPAHAPLLSPAPLLSRVARWLPDAELDDPSQPCGMAEVGAGVPMLAAPLALARPLHACGEAAAVPSSPSPPPTTTMLSGSVAVIERGGGCSFVNKVLEAQRQGAAAVVVLNTHRAAMEAAREEEEERLRKQQQQQAGSSANSCPSSADNASAGEMLAPPPLRPHHPTAMADDAWRAGERPRVPAVMLSPDDSARLLRLMRERGAGAATVVAAHGVAAAEGLRLIDARGDEGRRQMQQQSPEEEKQEEKGDYGDDDEEEEETNDAAPAPPPPPPGTWLALDRLLRTRLTRERVDLIVPPSSTEFVQRALLLPLQREKERWEAAVAALVGAGGGALTGGGRSLLLGSWAAAALPPPPLDAQAAFAQLATDPLARRVLQAGREQTLREERAAAEGVREAARQLAAARRQGRIRRELSV